jgi:hypothetical protein
MAYLPGTNGHEPWYVEFKRSENWQHGLIRRVSSAELRHYAEAADDAA